MFTSFPPAFIAASPVPQPETALARSITAPATDHESPYKPNEALTPPWRSNPLVKLPLMEFEICDTDVNN